MTQLLDASEYKLSVDEIEKLLALRNANPSTILYQAHYYPSWLAYSTISLLISGGYAEVVLNIWSTPEIIDADLARNLLLKVPEPNDVNPAHFQNFFDQVMQRSSTTDLSNISRQETLFEEERVVIPLNLAQYYDRKIRSLRAVDLVSQDEKSSLDGMLCTANILLLNERKNHFETWHPTGNYLQYFWDLCFLAMRCVNQHRSLKYLIALITWL